MYSHIQLLWVLRHVESWKSELWRRRRVLSTNFWHVTWWRVQRMESKTNMTIFLLLNFCNIFLFSINNKIVWFILIFIFPSLAYCRTVIHQTGSQWEVFRVKGEASNVNLTYEWCALWTQHYTQERNTRDQLSNSSFKGTAFAVGVRSSTQQLFHLCHHSSSNQGDLSGAGKQTQLFQCCTHHMYRAMG